MGRLGNSQGKAVAGAVYSKYTVVGSADKKGV